MLVKRATNSLIRLVRAALDLAVQVRGGGHLTELACHDADECRERVRWGRSGIEEVDLERNGTM
jgi:hypothetical protein